MRFHVVPPSRDVQMPLPAPPELRPQVLICTCHMPAKRMRGLFGSITRSEAPVLSFTNSTFSQVLPPSTRPIDASLRLRAVRMPERRDKHDVGIRGVHDDS